MNSLAKDNQKRSYECFFCQENFDKVNIYLSHLQSHDKEAEYPYRCNICNKTFSIRQRLVTHYHTHTGEKTYHCEHCNKSFLRKGHLNAHRKIHSKERPYKCDSCEYTFLKCANLHQHMQSHTGKRLYNCSVCFKKFSKNYHLTIHMRIHTGEKPYVCKACGNAFARLDRLKIHTRTHIGEKQSDSSSTSPCDSLIRPAIKILQTTNSNIISINSNNNVYSVIYKNSSDKENKTEELSAKARIYLHIGGFSYYPYSNNRSTSTNSTSSVSAAATAEDRSLFQRSAITYTTSKLSYQRQ